MPVVMTLMAVLFLAYANGANDNFKGVATLLGSGTSRFRTALLWGTAATACGSLAALMLARELVNSFSGRGLVPDSVVVMESFSLAVVFAAAATVILATIFGFPVSTTHALTGALAGAGLVASPAGINFSKLFTGFLGPLLASPVLAILLTCLIYPVFKFIRIRLNVTKETCLCAGTEIVGSIRHSNYSEERAAVSLQPLPTVTLGTQAFCHEHYQGRLLGISAGISVDTLHYLSAGVVSFARGLNDTPKIAAFLLAGSVMTPDFVFISVALFIAIGALLSANKVAETMSHRVTVMNAGQGFTANLATGFLAIFATRFGIPVSTTHLSCGALFGIGTVTRNAQWKTITVILAAWITTLPLSAILSSGTFLILQKLTAAP